MRVKNPWGRPTNFVMICPSLLRSCAKQTEHAAMVSFTHCCLYIVSWPNTAYLAGIIWVWLSTSRKINQLNAKLEKKQQPTNKRTTTTNRFCRSVWACIYVHFNLPLPCTVSLSLWFMCDILLCVNSVYHKEKKILMHSHLVLLAFLGFLNTFFFNLK